MPDELQHHQKMCWRERKIKDKEELRVKEEQLKLEDSKQKLTAEIK